MSFVELLAVAGTMASVLGVFLAIHARYNNRLIKEESRHAQEMLARIEQGQEETRKEVAEARKEMAEAFRKMDEGHRETMKYLEESRRETVKYLGDLIRADGERTREAIRGIRA